MPYRAIETECVSACGDLYVRVDVEFFTDAELSMRNDDTFGVTSLEEMPHQNNRILDPDWDEIPF